MPAVRHRQTGGRRTAFDWGNVAGGLSGAITSIPGNIAVGFVALSPLGADAQGGGVGVSLLAAGVGGGLFTSICRTRGLIAGGSMSFALVVAGVLATLVQRGVLQPGLAGYPGALAVVAILTLCTGLCEAGLAASGLGHVVTMLPYPVVSGIRNGVAILMISLQLSAVLGLVWVGGAGHWGHPAAIAVSATTFLLMLRPVRALRPIPPSLVGLLAGAAVHYGLAGLLSSRGEAAWLGPLLDVPAGMPHFDALWAGVSALPGLPPWALLSTLVPAALTIALISTLETLVGASVMQDISGEHGSSRRDLFALAAANAGCGLCGALPVTGGSPGSMAVWTAGGRGKSAGWIRSAVLLATVLLAGPAVGLLPTAALAGLVVSNGVQAFDREMLRLARRALADRTSGRVEMMGNLLVHLVVIGMAVAFGLVVAVLTGLVLSALLFVVAMSGRVVRRHYRNPGGRSRIVRTEWETETLLRHGAEIEVIELQGALFFGSADQLVREMDAAWASGARCVIVDFRRVSQIDLSGARRILQAATRCWQTGAYLAFAEVRPGSSLLAFDDALGPQARCRPDRVFSTVTEALAGAERAVLAAHGREGIGASLPADDVLKRLGFPKDEAAALLEQSPRLVFQAGSAIVRRGERADGLFILLEGEVEVSLPAEGSGIRARLATLTAGTLFGEMALLSGAVRSADVVAVTDVTCLGVDAASIAQFRRSSPEVAYYLMMAIAGQLASNLLMANVALTSAEE